MFNRRCVNRPYFPNMGMPVGVTPMPMPMPGMPGNGLQCGAQTLPMMPEMMPDGLEGGAQTLPSQSMMPLPGKVCNDPHVAVECVVEPTVHCAPNVINHHKKVEHIVPITTKNIHNYHNHHEYVVTHQPQMDEAFSYNHGLRPPASMCNL